jgi:hypothetical protein
MQLMARDRADHCRLLEHAREAHDYRLARRSATFHGAARPAPR